MYVTDALKILGENTARYAGGSHLTKRWAELLNPAKPDHRSGAEIAADVIQKAGLKVVSKDEPV